MKFLLILVALVAGFSSCVSAQTPAPLELKNIQIGVSTTDDVKKRFPGARVLRNAIIVTMNDYVGAKCGSNPYLPGPNYETFFKCQTEVQNDLFVGAGTMGTFWQFYIIDGNIESISVTFHSNGFVGASGSLEVKYGKASQTNTEIVKTKGGATFESKVMTWEHPDGSIRIDQISGNIDESRLVMSSSKYRLSREEAQKRSIIEGARKL